MSTEFKWDDETVMEFYNFHRDREGQWTSESIQQFKESKQPKREWEIIQVASPECGLYYLEGHKMRNNDKIYSVKRLSDGEVFTIGDRYKNDVGMKEYTIKEFEIRNGELRANATEHGFDYFSDLIKIKPLIITEDGIGYYAGEKKDIYAVPKYGQNAYKIDVHPEYYPSLSDTYDVFFSSKTKAEKYIRWNKPCLSLSEVVNMHSDISAIKQLAKTRTE